MTKAGGAALLVAGLLLLFFGSREADSLSSRVAKVFNDTPNDRSVLFLTGGFAVCLTGLYLALTRKN
jgi:hypothetical protein